MVVKTQFEITIPHRKNLNIFGTTPRKVIRKLVCQISLLVILFLRDEAEPTFVWGIFVTGNFKSI